MKIRNGFVSNSSSSSFVLFGIEIKDKTNKFSFKELIDLVGISEEKLENYWKKILSRKLYNIC